MYVKRLTFSAVLALGVWSLLTPGLFAKPEAIGLQEMIDRCEVIAVAHYVDEREDAAVTVELELTRIIKGDIKPGRYHVKLLAHPSDSLTKNGADFVAFFEKDLTWRFGAAPISKNNTVDNGVLGVSGFSSHNAFWVFPGLVTLRQIEQYLKDGTLKYSMRGPLYFPERGKLAWQASKIEVEVEYDAVKNTATGRGLPELKGFPSNPEVRIGRTVGNYPVTITFSRYMDMPLVIAGDVHGADGDVMLTKFFVTEPSCITLKDFEDYAADPRRGHVNYAIRINCTEIPGEPKPRVLTLKIEEQSGSSDVLEGWSKSQLKSDGYGGNGRIMTWRFKTDSGDELDLQFVWNQPDEGNNVFRWTFQEWLLYRLLVADIPGRLLLETKMGRQELTTFTATLADVGYVKLETPRTEIDWSSDERRTKHEQPTTEVDDGGEPEPTLSSGEVVKTTTGGRMPFIALVAAFAIPLAATILALLWHRARKKRLT